MVMKFANNAASTLAGGISSSATSLSVQTGDGALFPTLGAGDYFYCTLQQAASLTSIEIVKVTARTSDTFTIVRAQDNTTALAFSAADKVELRLVAAVLNDLPKLDESNTFNGTQTFSNLTTTGNTILGDASADTLTINAVGTANAAQRGGINTLTDGATTTPDFSVANYFKVTLGGNRTLANPTSLTAGQSGVIVITQDGTGSRTLAYGSYWKFPGGTAPTLTTTASAVDVLAYYVESSTRITARLVADVK